MNRCTICTHPRISYIDSLIVNRRTLLSISNEVRLSYPALRRHVKGEHVARPIGVSVAPARVGRPVPTKPDGVYAYSADEDAIHDAALAEWLGIVASSTGLDADALRACWTGVPHPPGCATCDAADAAADSLVVIESRHQNAAEPYQHGRVVPR